MKFLILAACVCVAVALPQRGVKKAGGVVASPSLAAGHVAPKPASTAASTPTSSARKATRSSGNTDEVLRSESDVRPDGYSYSYETANGIVAESNGNLKKVGEKSAMVITGSYQYIDADGKTVKVTYIADENGFQPQSDVLPTPPPTPKAILAALKHIKEHPYTEPKKVKNHPSTESKKVKRSKTIPTRNTRRSKATPTRNQRRSKSLRPSLHGTQEGQKR